MCTHTRAHPCTPTQIQGACIQHDSLGRCLQPPAISLITSDSFPLSCPLGHVSLIIQTGQRSQTLIMWRGVKGEPAGVAEVKEVVVRRSRAPRTDGRFGGQPIQPLSQMWLAWATGELIPGRSPRTHNSRAGNEGGSVSASGNARCRGGIYS